MAGNLGLSGGGPEKLIGPDTFTAADGSVWPDPTDDQGNTYAWTQVNDTNLLGGQATQVLSNHGQESFDYTLTTPGVVCASVVDNSTNAASYSMTPSFTGGDQTSATRLNLLVVRSTIASGVANAPTVTGGGQTWDQILTKSQGVRTVTVFKSMGAWDTTALTIDFAAQTQNNCICIWLVFDNVNTTGINGAGAIGTSVINSKASGTTWTHTLPSAPAASSTVSTFAFNASGSITPSVRTGDAMIYQVVALETNSYMTSVRAGDTATVRSGTDANTADINGSVEIVCANTSATATAVSRRGVYLGGSPDTFLWGRFTVSLSMAPVSNISSTNHFPWSNAVYFHAGAGTSPDLYYVKATIVSGKTGLEWGVRVSGSWTAVLQGQATINSYPNVSTFVINVQPSGTSDALVSVGSPTLGPVLSGVDTINTTVNRTNGGYGLMVTMNGDPYRTGVPSSLMWDDFQLESSSVVPGILSPYTTPVRRSAVY